MPENDLGTAHGNIRLDLDDRASAKTDAALAKIAAQMKALDDRFSKFEKTFNDYDKALQKNTVNLDKASKVNDKFSKGLIGVHQNVVNLSKDFKTLYNDINKVSTAVQAIKDIGKPFLTGAKALDAFQTSMKSGTGHLLSYKAALAATGIVTGDFAKRTAVSLIGVDKAMRQLPRWSQDIYKYAGVLTLAGAATARFSKFADAGGVTKYLNAFAKTEPLRKFILSNEQVALSTERLFRTLERAPRALDNFVKPLGSFGTDARRFLAGTALLTSGINDVIDKFAWLGKIPKPILYGLGVSISQIIPAALSVMSKALVVASNFLEGTLDAVKQLAGGFLVLPGLFATIGAAASALIPVFAGLKNQFKDIFSDDYFKSLEALYSLPAHLIPLGTTLKAVYDRFKDMQIVLQTIAFKGLEDQINSLSNTYFPRFQSGATQVILAVRQMKDEFVGFALATQTQKDFSTIYANTAQALTAVGRAIRPAADGLRDLAVVGNQFITDMSGGLPQLTQQFANWARANRENGKLLEWMSNAEHGVYQLTKGTELLAQGLWRVVTIFRTNTGTDFLDTFVVQMNNLNNAIQKSAASGFLNSLSNGVRSLASQKLDSVKDLFRSFGNFAHDAMPFIKQLSDAFSTTFVGALKLALEELGFFIQVFHAIGLDTAIGLVYGLVSAWNAFSAVCLPLIAKLKIIGGLFLTITNASKLTTALESGILAIAAGLEKLGPAGAKAGEKIVNVASSLSGMISIASRAGAIMAAAAIAIGAVWLVMSQGQDEILKFRGALNQLNNNTDKFAAKLHAAFIEDRGFKGHTVMTAITQGLEQMESDLKNAADSAPGTMAKIRQGFNPKNLFSDWSNLGDALLTGPLAPITLATQFSVLPTKDKDLAQQIGQSEFAGKAVAGLEELRKKGVDVSSAVADTDEGFGKFIASLDKSDQNIQAAAAYLTMYHLRVQEANKDAAELGQSGAEAAIGFDKIAKSAGDAESKLEGLKMVLEALGILKTSSLEAAAHYGDAIEGMSKKIQDAIDAGDGLGNVFKNGSLNVALEGGSQTARNLVPVFNDLSNAFLNFAAHGGNVDQMLADVNGKLQEWSGLLGTDQQTLKNFLTNSEGLVATPLKLLVQLDKPGLDDMSRQLLKTMVDLQTMANNGGVFVPIGFDSHDAASKVDKQLEQILGKDYFDSSGSNLTLKAGVVIPPEDMAKLQAFLASQGISFGNAPVAGAPQAQIPTQVVPATPPGSGTQPVLPPGPGGLTAPAFPSTPAGPNPTANLPAEIAPPDVGGQVQANVQQGFNGALAGADTFTQALIDKLSNKDFLGQVHDAGVKFDQALAQGFTDNQAEAFRAAEQMAQGIKDRFHQSPPKKGPLSAHGDAVRYAGQQFVKAYAGGMNQARPAAAAAAAGVASSAASGVSGGSALGGVATGAPGNGAGGIFGGGSYYGPGGFPVSGGVGGTGGFSSSLGGVAAGGSLTQQEEIGKVIGKRFSSLIQFFGHVVDAVSKVATIGLQFGKFLSDPLGQGKFFGQSLGQAFGYKPVGTKYGALTPNQKLADRRFGLGVNAAGSQTFAGLNNYDPLTGTIKPLAGQIGASSPKADLQRAIALGGQAVGAKPEDIAAALSIVDREDPAYNPLAIGKGLGSKGTDAVGLFQQSPYADPALWGTPESLIGNPQQQIDNYWKRWQQVGPQGTDYWGKPGDAIARALSVQGASGYGREEVQRTIKDNLETVKQLMQGGVTPFGSGALPGIGTSGIGLAPPPILHDEGGLHSQIASQTSAALIASLFPQITNIGGAHPDRLPYHREGRALDVMIPGDYKSPQGVALGNQIRDFFLANSQALGVADTIFNDMYYQPGKSPEPYHAVDNSDNERHLTHVHITFNPGATPNLGPQGSNLKFPLGAPNVLPQSSFGPPQVPGAGPPSANSQLWQWDADKKQYVPAPTGVPGGPGSQSLPQGWRLTATPSGPGGGLEIKDQLTGKIIDTVPANISSPIDVKDPNTGEVLGRVFPGAKPNEQPFLAPPEALGPNGQPWTPEAAAAFQQQHPLQVSYPAGTPLQDVNAVPGLFPGGQLQSQYQLQQALGPNNQQAYQQGLLGQNPQQALQTLEAQRQQYLNMAEADPNSANAPLYRYQAGQIGNQQQDIMSQNNLEEAANPFDTAINFLGQASGVAGDVINSIQAGLDALSGTADITDTVSRGISNTKDVSKIIDDMQKYITFAADIAQTTGDVLTTVGSIAGAAGGASGAPGGGSAGAALQAAGEVASLISAGLQTVNAVIDLGQEFGKIAGTFIGPKLENLVGGAEGGLTGDVKFLLDTATNQLSAYSADNPLDKRYHTLFDHGNQVANPDVRNQVVGQLNYYAGPGTDPRDDTRQMMYQVKTAQLMNVTNG